MSSETLSHEEAIGQFCGVTGADEERAKCLLEACDWNLELAINMHVDTDDSTRNRPSTSNSAAGPSTSDDKKPSVVTINDSHKIIDEELVDADDDDDSSRGANHSMKKSEESKGFDGASMFAADRDSVRAPIPPIRQVLVQHPASYISDLPHRRYNTRTGATSDSYDAFRDFRAEGQWQEEVARQEGTEGSVASEYPSQSNSYKRRTLHDLFRPPLELMFRGEFVSAREKGTSQNRWLLVNVQDPKEFACQALNRDVWNDPKVREILTEHFILWQVYRDTHDGTKYLQFYKVRRFPHISIIDPRTGEEMRSLPAKIDREIFCDSVIEFLTDHPSPDGTNDANKMKRLRIKEENVAPMKAKTLYDLSEEAQVEAAIKASLQEVDDKPRVSHLDEDEDEDEMCEVVEVKKEKWTDGEHKTPVELTDGDEDEDEDIDEDVVGDDYEVVIAKDIDDNENTMDDNNMDNCSDHSIESFSSAECTCRIALRFPDGSSLVQKFSPRAPLAAVRHFVRRQKKKNVSHVEFVAPPNKKLTESMMSQTLEDLGLTPASRLEVVFGSGD